MLTLHEPRLSSVAHLYSQVSRSGQVTLADRYGMMAAILEESPKEEELEVLDRIFYGIRRGRFRLVNEPSDLDNQKQHEAGAGCISGTQS